MSLQTQHDDLKAEYHELKCDMVDLRKQYGDLVAYEHAKARDAQDELRASEKYREHARQRCIYLEKVIKILLDTGEFHV